MEKKLIALLKNKHNYIISKIYQSSDTDFKIVTCYDKDGYGEETHFAEFWIKWDACSHWTFNGERYWKYEDGTESDIDGYYHICGVNSYFEHYRYMMFALKVFIMTERISDRQEIKDFEKYSSVLDDCTVELINRDKI